MTTANIAEETCPVRQRREFSFKLENFLTLVDEKYVALLQDAESQAVANLPAGAEANVESHIVRPSGDTDHWMKLETGAKSAEQKRGSRRGDSWWPRTRRKPRVGDSRCCKPCYSRG